MPRRNPDDDSDERPAPTEKACPQCAESVKVAAKICRFCGYDFASGRRLAPASAPSAGIALIVALLLPGGGHVYAGRVQRALVVWGVYAALGLGGFAFAAASQHAAFMHGDSVPGDGALPLVFLACALGSALLYAWQAFDAYTCASEPSIR